MNEEIKQTNSQWEKLKWLHPVTLYPLYFSLSVLEPNEINKQFKDFYESLCTFQDEFSSNLSDQFPDGLPLNTLLLLPQTDYMEEDIFLLEAQKAIGSFNSGKVPGCDGFPTDFYNTFINQLVLILSEIYSKYLQQQ